MRQIKELPSLTNVAAGNTATLNLPVGPTYEQFLIEYSGVTLAQLKNLEIQANGKTLQKWKTAADLDLVNQFYGRGAASGILSLWMVRPELVEIDQQRLTALGTADVQTATLRVDIDAAASAPAITAYAVQSASQPMGLIAKVREFPRTFATSGEQEIDSIPRPGSARIAAMHLVKSDVSAVEVEANSRIVVEGSKSIIHERLKRYGRNPQAGSMTHVDFLAEGDLFDALRLEGLQDFRLRPTLDTTGEIRSYVEYLDGWQGL